jgi:DNA-binding NarL/FixJ family response regulator
LGVLPDRRAQEIGVSLVEDDPRTCEDLSALVSSSPGLHLVSTHPTAADALERLPLGTTQVALVDIQLPRLSGVECTQRLFRRDPDLLVLMLTVHDDTVRLFDSLRAGAVGSIPKRDPPGDIVQSVFNAVAGGAPMSPSIARKVIQHFRALSPAQVQTADQEDRLSPREYEIVRLVAAGYSYKEIAAHLNLSIETVRTYLKRAYRKLGVSSGAAAVAKTLGRRG